MRYPALRPLVFVAMAGTLILSVMVYHRDNLAAGYDNVVSTVKTTAANNNIPLPFAADDTPRAPVDNYISVCLAIKDQRRDLPQFLNHHYYNMGVGKFFIMDDGTTPPLSEMTDAELTIPRSAIEFHYYKPEAHERWMQYTLYNHCAQFARNSTTANTTTTWMAFIDADEFIDAPGPQTLRAILEDYERIEAIGAVGLNWRVHTSNGHLTRQPSMIDAYTECIYDDDEHHNKDSQNAHVKSIVRLKAYHQPHDPHFFYLTENHITVGENGDQITSALRKPITRNRLALHHYALKSREEFEEKMQRGSAMSNKKGWDTWELLEETNPHVPCPEMLRWSPTRTQ